MSSLEQFMVFKEVAEIGNITQASKRLHISQPSVSIQIQNLEHEYGAPLFYRTNRGVTLTDPGNIPYEKVILILHAAQQAKETIHNYSANQTDYIHIGATLTIGEYLLPHMMSITHRDHSLSRYNVQVANTHVIVNEVLGNYLNIGFIEGIAPEEDDLNVEQFWSDELVLIVPTSHPWGNQDEITFDELLSERFITRENGSGTREVLKRALEEGGFAPDDLNIAIELGSTQAIKEAVLSNLGVTIISALTVQEECRQKRLHMLRLKGCQLKRPLNIITNRKCTLSPEEEWFLGKVRCRETLHSVLPEPLLPGSAA